ncbi:uroporphyrinogen decarboxylase [Atractiella rhizophila]|nr:uroporphyrinogen decarboxylase [Atractiella rhizophila]
MSEFAPLKNDLLLRAARGENVERSPVWVMRQAGRYLPEFRAVREKHSFFEICQTPSLAAEITIQPVRRYKGLLDAAILFCDILVIPQALGLVVEMNPAPFFPSPISTPEEALEIVKKHVDVDKELGYAYEAIKLVRQQLNGEVPLIGFVGGPWTLVAYMIEGGGGKGFNKAKTWLYKHPEESHKLLQKTADACADFLIGQIRAGAQLVQVFDSWAGELTPKEFRTFSLPYLRYISKRVRERLASLSIVAVPMTIFAMGANQSLPLLADSGYETVGIDWKISPKDARQLIGSNVTIQGNLDPSILYAGREAIDREVKEMILGNEGFGTGGRHICNLGHGITPGVDPEEGMKAFLEAVHKYSVKK